MTRRTLLAIVFAGLPMVATAKPNFTGNWKMNTAKSSFGDFPAPERYEVKVTHSDPNLTYTTTRSGFQGGADITYELKYTTDGKESTNSFRGGEARGTAKWEGDVLVIESTRSTPNGEIKILERWTSVDDGKGLQIDTKFSGSFGENAFKTYLEKQ